jgi:hypothetical protein
MYGDGEVLVHGIFRLVFASFEAARSGSTCKFAVGRANIAVGIVGETASTLDSPA